MTSAKRAALHVLLGVSLASAGLFPVHEAAAEPTAEDLASARELFKEGRAARERGDLTTAIEKLRAAHALGQTPITGIELARTYVLVGKLVDAREISLGVARLPLASDETARSATARTDAAKLATDLEPRLAKLVITLKGLPAGATPHVTVDGEAIPVEALGEARRADPGPHVAVLTLPGGEERRAQATLEEGEGVTMVLDAAPAPAATNGTPDAAPEGSPVHARHHTDVVLLAGAVTAGAGVLFGVGFGALTLNAKSGLQKDCPGGRCAPQYYGELDNAHSDAAVSTAAFIVGGVGASAVILDLLLLRSKHEAARAALAPDIGVGWVGAHGSF